MEEKEKMAERVGLPWEADVKKLFVGVSPASKLQGETPACRPGAL
jgi:hypothetical protein